METISFKILDVDDKEASTKIRQAADILRAGGLVIFPTETVYGLGGDGTSNFASAKIYSAKGRPSDNPLILHIAKPEDAEQYTITSSLYYKLAKAFMPGPLTVIMPAKDVVPLTVRAGLPTVAVRCPSHPVAHKLISAFGRAIAAPSANLSGKPSPTCYAHVKDDMDGRVDMMMDGGPCEVGLESTIVKIEGDALVLLRPGKITLEQLYQVCPNITVSSAVTNQLEEGQQVLSPGMKYRHYAPTAPLYLLKGSIKSRQNFVLQQNDNIALLCYNDEMELYKHLSHVTLFPIGNREDLHTQAHLLFYALREADKGGFRAIYAPLPPMDGIGLALYNRMIRAAAYQIIETD